MYKNIPIIKTIKFLQKHFFKKEKKVKNKLPTINGQKYKNMWLSQY